MCWDVPILGLTFGMPLAAVVAGLQLPALPFSGTFANAFIVMVAFDPFDRPVIDRLVLCTLTPRFVVLPGTEPCPPYRPGKLAQRGGDVDRLPALPGHPPAVGIVT